MSDEYKDVVERLEEDLHRMDNELHGLDYGMYVRFHDSTSEAITLLKRYRDGLEVQASTKFLTDPAHYASKWDEKAPIELPARIDHARKTLGDDHE